MKLVVDIFAHVREGVSEDWEVVAMAAGQVEIVDAAFIGFFEDVGAYQPSRLKEHRRSHADLGNAISCPSIYSIFHIIPHFNSITYAYYTSISLEILHFL